MTKHPGDPTPGRDGASPATRDEGDRSTAGDAPDKGEQPLPDDRAGSSAADGDCAIDLDAARDRAS